MNKKQPSVVAFLIQWEPMNCVSSKVELLASHFANWAVFWFSCSKTASSLDAVFVTLFSTTERENCRVHGLLCTVWLPTTLTCCPSGDSLACFCWSEHLRQALHRYPIYSPTQLLPTLLTKLLPTLSSVPVATYPDCSLSR